MKIEIIATFLITFFITLIATLFCIDIRSVFDPPFLLPILNTIFLCFIPLFVSGTFSKVFLMTGQLQALMLSQGMMAIALGALISGWFIGTSHGPNVTITIYNSSALICALFHALSYIIYIHTTKVKRTSLLTIPPNKRPIFLIVIHIIILIIIGGIVYAAIQGLTPLYIQQGIGPTLIGRTVLGTSIVLLGLCSILGNKQYHGIEIHLIRWYITGLGLLAIGMTGVFLQKAVGSPIGWAGRFSQYTGGLCLLIGVISFWRTLFKTNYAIEAVINIILNEAKDNYRALIETAPDGIITVDSNGHILIWNKTAEIIFGYLQKEVIGIHLSKLIFHCNNVMFNKYLNENAPNIIVIETVVKKKNGILFPSEISISQRPSSAGRITTLIVKDITKRKQIEEEIKQHEKHLDALVQERTKNLHEVNQQLLDEMAQRQESEERWQFALEGAGDGLWDWNVQKDKLFLSKQCQSMLGYNHDEINSSRDEWIKLIHPDDQKKCFDDFNKCFLGEIPIYINEYRMLCKNGSYKWVLDRGKVIQWIENSTSKSPLRMIGVYTDITERKILEAEKSRMQEHLFRASKLASIGTLANGMAHEINNPLTIIKGYASMLIETLQKNEALKAELAMLMNLDIATDRITSIINRLKILTQFDKDSSLGVNINIVIKETISLVENVYNEAEIKIFLRNNSNESTVMGNFSKIQYVILNILSNAKDAIDEIKTITQKTGTIKIDLRNDERNLYLSISDNGKGIKISNLSQIFDPFFTTKGPDKGVGLGLSISHAIIESMDGRIEVDGGGVSDERDIKNNHACLGGATFRLILPLKKR